MVAAILIILSMLYTFGSFTVGKEYNLVKYEVPFGYYQSGWLIMYVALGWMIASAVKKKFGLTAAVLVFYLIFHGVWASLWWLNGWENVEAIQQLGYRWQAGQALFGLLLVVTPLLVQRYTREQLMEYGGILAAIFCAISSVTTVAQFLFSKDHCTSINSCGGVLYNPSQNAGFIVATLPFVIKYFSVDNFTYLARAIAACAVCAVIVSKSSVALGLLAVLIGLNAVYLRKWSIALAVPALGGAGLLLLGQTELLSSGDRLPLWTMLVDAILLHPVNPVKAWGFGTGFGSIGVVTLGLQELFKFRPNNWWAWMHNDWLEMLLATGVTGLFLLAAIYFQSLYRFIRDREPHEALALVLYGILTFLNPTLHIGLTAVFGAWIVAAGLLKEETWSGQRSSPIFSDSWLWRLLDG